MLPVSIQCRAPAGLAAPPVSVEVFLGPGLPGLNIVGLVETAVKESRDRVRAAIQNSGFDMPDRRIIVSLAPADLPKSGSRYDLAIAVGILCASKQIPAANIERHEFFGELSLAGNLRLVAGSLPVAMSAIESGHRIVLPADCGQEAGLLKSADVLTASSLLEVAEYLGGQRHLTQATCNASTSHDCPELADVQGQAQAKRALEIAAVGGHNLLFVGPPGTGKSMLAERLPGLLPEQSHHEALETAAVYSLSGTPLPGWKQRPFRSPHHSATAVALAGGSSPPRPGEITLAHHGVLFLDELPEFSRTTLEVLREPMESGKISVARARGTTIFPARFQLIAAMNPCQCGYLGDKDHECCCTPDQVKRYRQRISGPFLDRIDICVPLNRQTISFSNNVANENHDNDNEGNTKEEKCNATTAQVRKRITIACRYRAERNNLPNSQLDSAAIEKYCWPDKTGLNLLESAAAKLALSHRACNRALRVARSIADLADKPRVKSEHIAEALSLRQALVP